MTDSPIPETPSATGPTRPLPPDGFWITPGGAEGLCGSVAGVLKVIDEMTDADLPTHHKTCLREAIAADLEGTDFNYVRIHAHGVCNQTETSRRSIVHLDIATSKKNL